MSAAGDRWYALLEEARSSGYNTDEEMVKRIARYTGRTATVAEIAAARAAAQAAIDAAHHSRTYRITLN